MGYESKQRPEIIKKPGIAIVLAAGRGSRMKSAVPKQYLPLNGRPVLAWSLAAFQEFEKVGEILLVTSEEEIDFCRNEIVERYGLDKVTGIVPGGAERYLSVWEGLKAARDFISTDIENDADRYVWIHDGARPLIDAELLERVYGAVVRHKACVTGMPAKDTIKISDRGGFVKETPDRRALWQVQTPQVFSYPLIYEAYRKLIDAGICDVTDDAMVVERMTGRKVKLVEGSYRNLKITTPDDLKIAEVLLQKEKRS